MKNHSYAFLGERECYYSIHEGSSRVDGRYRLETTPRVFLDFDFFVDYVEWYLHLLCRVARQIPYGGGVS